MPTREEVKAKYRQIHANLTDRYYNLKELSKADFETLHAKCWADMQQELIDNGYGEIQYDYRFKGILSTALGDFELNVNILSPIQLTPAQINNYRDKLKQVGWQLSGENERFVEV